MIVIIGSGILGVSAAYQLIKQGEEVLLVDADFEGKATIAGAGIICPWISTKKDPDFYELAKASATYYPSLIEELGRDGEGETGYDQCGALALGRDDQEIQLLYDEAVNKREKTAFVGEVKKLTNKEAKDHFPPLQEGVSAVYVSGGARVDGKLLNQALVQAFVKRGGKLLTERVELFHEGEEVIVQTSEGNIRAEQVIVAAGAWSKQLLDKLDVSITLEPQRGQIAHVHAGEDTASWPVVLPQSSHYIVAFDDSRVVFGATREAGSGFDYRLTAGGVEEVLHEGLSVAPGLKSATLGEVRVGFRPMGPDALPLLGKVEGFRNLIVATGLGPSGLTIGPYAGKLAAKLAMQQEVEHDLAPFNPLRT
ncbi:FAD-dependent oxidoreductase [Alkalibacillus silvisoli]|uniref:FAD-binding oxidoreductase n=1 Tax=Alkalibacillus silvisoli TaxID=392823 RepID=A0ABP3K262_9BACI